jgi:hypothetical protein
MQTSADEEEEEEDPDALDLDVLDLNLFHAPESDSESSQTPSHATDFMQEVEGSELCSLGTACSTQSNSQMHIAKSSFEGLIKRNSYRRTFIVLMKHQSSKKGFGIRHLPQTKVEKRRAQSDNSYLRTLKSGSEPIRVERYKCGTLIGEDESPSCTTLPPFRVSTVWARKTPHAGDRTTNTHQNLRLSSTKEIEILTTAYIYNKLKEPK